MSKLLISIGLILTSVSFHGQIKSDYSNTFIEDLYKVSSPIKSFNANTSGFDDLEPIGKAIGERKIVFLGEPSHGDGGAIQMKTRIVKYLHEKKGFDVLLFENDLCSILFDLSELHDTISIRQNAQENILTCWSKSSVSQDLWSYYNQQLVAGSKLYIGGVDPRHSGKFARTNIAPLLTAQLNKLNYNTNSVSYQRLLKDMNYIFRNQLESKKDSVDIANFVKEMKNVEEVFKYHIAPVEKRNLWLLEIINLKNCFAYLIEGKQRDIIMAQNLSFFSKYIYPGKKIMVWSHNNHNVMDVNIFTSFDPAFAKAWYANNTYEYFTYLGTDVYREFGNDVYSLAISSGSGNFSPNFMENSYFVQNFTTAKVPKSSEKSIEHYLAGKKCHIVFIPFPNVQGRPSGYPWFASRLLDLSYELKLDYVSAFSGMIYINQTIDLNGY